jgi:hypothetical protein
LAWAPIDGGGIAYTLPYPINITGTSNQWLEIFDIGGAPSDMVNFANTGPGGVGVMSIYSNDTDGDVADVTPAVFSGYAANFGGYSTNEDASDIAFYSTYGDTSGVPGDPAPHPTIEANYYVDSSVPEPASLGLLALGVVGLLARHRRA